MAARFHDATGLHVDGVGARWKACATTSVCALAGERAARDRIAARFRCRPPRWPRSRMADKGKARGDGDGARWPIRRAVAAPPTVVDALRQRRGESAACASFGGVRDARRHPSPRRCCRRCRYRESVILRHEPMWRGGRIESGDVHAVHADAARLRNNPAATAAGCSAPVGPTRCMAESRDPRRAAPAAHQKAARPQRTSPRTGSGKPPAAAAAARR